MAARDKLKLRREPYWHHVTKGAFLGYRKMMQGPGSAWVAPVLDETTEKQIYKALGDFSDIPDHLRFDAAQSAAREWFTHLSKVGLKLVITLAEACKRYVAKARAEGRASSAIDLEGRFRHWVYSDAKLSNTPVMKLTPGVLNDWRNKLVNTPAIEQDKTKIPSRPRLQVR